MTINAEAEMRRNMVRRIKEKKAAFLKLSSVLFEPVEKNPYYLFRGNDTSITIRNLTDLRYNLDAFTKEEAYWLALWLEYLGDNECAGQIRERPEKFKHIIMKRYNDLREFYPLKIT